MRFRWSLSAAQSPLAAKLAAELQLEPLLVQCLLNRGLEDATAIAGYLEPRLKSLADPFVLPNMHGAVERLFVALERGERVVIFGDYDVDGVSSTALLLEVLEAFGFRVDAYLPHRFDEGYGLSRDGAENCLKKHPATLLIAVDCGTTSVASINWLRASGVDVIVLDHHQPGESVPETAALVNPHLDACSSTDSKALCSAGLAFKLAHALVKRGRNGAFAPALAFDVRQLLDLVALGTIADLVPLRGENRALVAAGLRVLNETARPGLIALKSVARASGAVGVFEVAFQLAPRLNAAGRLENAEAALRLLRTRDAAEANRLAGELDAQNRERQQIERDVVDEVTDRVRATFKADTDYAIVESGSSWHIGVVGIVASRLVREFYRPTIVIGSDGKEWRGSGRSIEGFDLAWALSGCADLLARHGGHSMAAGLTIEEDKIDLFRNRLNEMARERLQREHLSPVLRLDAEVRMADLTLGLTGLLQKLEPVGQGNPAVQLMGRNLRHERPPQPLGRDRKHTKLWVTDGTAVHEAVWWNSAGEAIDAKAFDLAFAPQVNEFNGRRTVQLKVLDWRPSSPADPATRAPNCAV